jgi:RNA ligase (TIGR02306 family)
MPRKLVSIQKIEEILPIEGADRIEKIRIKGWWVVSQKGVYKTGDLVLFYEIDSFLPIIPEYDFLLKGASPKKMLVEGVEKEGIRLRTVKLRKQISQGLIMPLSLLDDVDEIVYNVNIENVKKDIGADVSELLGIIKYEPPISANLSGIIKGSFPYFIPKTDEERIQNIPEILNEPINEFWISEKCDGVSVSFYKKDGIFGVCSRNLELSDCDCTQWNYAKEKNLINLLPEGFAIQGELVGEKIQGNPLKIKGHKVYFFNVYDINNRRYYNFNEFKYFIENIMMSETVPVIKQNTNIPRAVEELIKLAEGKSILNINVEREGIVIRPMIESKFKDERFSFKAINNVYLLNNEQ